MPKGRLIMHSVPPVTTLSTRVAPFNPTVMISAEAFFGSKESRAFRKGIEKISKEVFGV